MLLYPCDLRLSKYIVTYKLHYTAGLGTVKIKDTDIK